MVGSRLGSGLVDHDRAWHGASFPRGHRHVQRDLQHRLQVRQDVLAHVVSHPLEMASAVCGIIGYGVLERHPKLKVLFCEAGATWVPTFCSALTTTSRRGGKK